MPKKKKLSYKKMMELAMQQGSKSNNEKDKEKITSNTGGGAYQKITII